MKYIPALLPRSVRLRGLEQYLLDRDLPWWQAVLLPLATVLAVEAGRRTGLTVPVPYLLMLSSVILAAGLSGLRAGLLGGLLAVGFTLHAARVGFGPPTLIGSPLRVTLGSLLFLGLGAYLGLLRDGLRAARARDRQALIEHVGFLEHLQRITQATLDRMDPEALYQVCVDEIGALLRADACYLTRWDADTQTTLPLAASGPRRESYRDMSFSAGAQTLTAQVIAQGAPLVVEDVRHAPEVPHLVRSLFPEEEALLVLPIQAGEQAPLGALIAAYSRPRRFGPQELTWAQQAVDLTALALHRALLHRRLQEQVQDLSVVAAQRGQALERFFELSPIPMLIGHLDGHTVRFNRAWEDALGYGPEDGATVRWHRLIHPEDWPCFEEAAACLRREGAVKDLRLRVRSAAGHYRWLAGGMALVGDQVYVIAQDVTEQERLMAELQAARAQAEAANRAKSDFLAMMSHELRTPLNAILGFADLLALQASQVLDERQRRYVANIRHSGHLLLGLINDLLDLSKIEAGRMELDLDVVRMERVVAEVAEAVAPLALKREHDLSLDLDTPVPAVLADRERIHQILYNLLSNAIKYTPPQGRIRVTLRPLADRVGVHLTVCDNGIGLSETDLERIFRPFEQVDSPYTRSVEGTGLGLALTQRLVELHGGRIWVESPGPDQGSTFHVELPAAPPGYLRRGETTSPGPRVLVVEDDLNDGDLVAQYLQDAGLGVIRAYRAAEALELVREYGPDLIVLDILMSPQDGWHVLEQLQTDPMARLIPVVVVSITEDVARGRAYNVQHWLVKPIAAADLIAAVQEALAQGRPRAKVLLVGRRLEVLEQVCTLLRDERCLVEMTNAFREAPVRALHFRPDLVILDPEGVDPPILAMWIRQLRLHPLTAATPVLALAETPPASSEVDTWPAHVAELAQVLAARGLYLGHPTVF